MPSKLVSMIIPALNEKDNLLALLSGLRAQAYRPLEVIIVDGGSSDGTFEAASKMALESGDIGDFRVRVSRETGTRRGPANARNIGISIAEGDYIIFLDADFELPETSTVASIVESLNDHKAVGVLTQPACTNWLERQQWLDRFDKKLNGVPHTFCAYRRSTIGEHRFELSLGFGEDQVFQESLGVETYYIPVSVKRHFVHGVGEWSRQMMWYGRTYPRFIKRSGTGATIRLLLWVNPPILLLLALIGLLLNSFLFSVFSTLLATSLAVSVMRGHSISPDRIAYVIVARLLMTIVLGCGFIVGSAEFLRENHLSNSG
ncbi:MAG: glycosyltransferase [Nitrososphaerales archaeon]|nr:glycosyltransferase [Nitrososphaerales archaeon]